MWRPTREEIEEWLEKKEIKFAKRENINPRYDAKRWLYKYINSYLHEIFFVEFPIILAEWLLSLCENNHCCKDE